MLAAGVPHHADWGVPVARRVSVSASRMRAIGDGWFRYRSNATGPSASRTNGRMAGMNSMTWPSTSITG